jgi:hypothetical protein
MPSHRGTGTFDPESERDVYGLDVRDRVWRALPNDLRTPAIRQGLVVRRLRLDEHVVGFHLRAMKRRGQATQEGGWWRALGELCPSSAAETFDA